MALKTVTTQVTYKIPAWHSCNMQASITGKPSKEMCRFCVKEKGYYRCALYNDILDVSQGSMVLKSDTCCRAGRKSVVEESTPTIDPAAISKAAITEYIKVRKSLLAQGYPESLADKAALEYIVGGK